MNYMNIPDDVRLKYFYRDNYKHLNNKKIEYLIESGMTETILQNSCYSKSEIYWFLRKICYILYMEMKKKYCPMCQNKKFKRPVELRKYHQFHYFGNEDSDRAD